MEIIALNAQKRTRIGKEANKKIRAELNLPGVIYGEAKENILTEVDYKEFHTILHNQGGTNVILSIVLDEGDEKETVVVREIQFDPVTHTLLHIDFQRILLDKVAHFSVPTRGAGSSIGVKSGGILEHHTREFEIRCLPADIPDFIEIDVTNLDVGDSIRLGEISLPDNIELLSSKDTVVFAVIAPKAVVVEEEVEEGEEGALEEPELVGSKEEKEEEEEQQSSKK